MITPAKPMAINLSGGRHVGAVAQIRCVVHIRVASKKVVIPAAFLGGNPAALSLEIVGPHEAKDAGFPPKNAAGMTYWGIQLGILDSWFLKRIFGQQPLKTLPGLPKCLPNP